MNINGGQNNKMVFCFHQMNQRDAEEIAHNWQYDGIYSFYNISADEEDYLDFINPSKRGNKYFSCYSDGELVAFYSVEILKDDKAELGLGMKLEFTGKGLGVHFVNAVLAHTASAHGMHDFVLSVALFNQRAINVYKAVGFTESNVFIQITNGGNYEFLSMVKKCCCM
jgi:ribosomal-protein-alanine N-acetyltransferase